MTKRVFLSSLLGVAALLVSSSAFSQKRILGSVPESEARISMVGTVPPRAKAAADLGLVAGDRRIEALSLRFNMTPSQTASLERLLQDQQNPRSPQYHQWLTPEQFGAEFGLSEADLNTIVVWLQHEGFAVTGVARGRSFVTFSGAAAQVNQAFGVSLHNVFVDGEQHITNFTEPTLPASIAGVTQAITGLNDFRLKPRAHPHKVDAKLNGGSQYGNLLAPGDFYTIYDMKSLLGNSVNGAGVTIAIAGQTDISTTDYNQFRTAAGLSTANPPAVKLYGTDPGLSTNDFGEAMIDVEWSGATAPGANILYVNSTDVINTSLTQAIDDKLAPIVSVSYGNCEQQTGNGELAQLNHLFMQANAQGQTVLGPAGDSGAADCDYQVTYAAAGLAVDFPASSPYVTSVGATEFNEGGGVYWSAADGANAGSALSYIPEQPWNETYDLTNMGTLAGLNFGSGGGGLSQYFAKPAWQIGTGVPADASRDVPDLAFNGAAQHDGYVVCAGGGDCANGFVDGTGSYDVYGGTSVSAPTFAGILAVLEQKLGVSGLGNVNPNIYGLANSPYVGMVFHDVTSGNNAVPCVPGSTDCGSGYPGFFAAGTLLCPANSCSGDAAYASIGYTAGSGYDLTSGWGSVDVANLVADWTLAAPVGVSTSALNSSTVSVTTSAGTVTAGTAVTITATVGSGTTGVTATPTGTVTLLVDNVVAGSAVTLNAGAAVFPAYSTASLPSGQHAFSVSYSGDTNYAGSKGSTSVDVTSASSGDFSLTPTTTSVSVASGGTANGVTFTVTSLNGFAGDVSFTAGTNDNLNANYVFSVDPVVISGAGAGTTVLTLEAFSTAANAGPFSKALKRAEPGKPMTGATVLTMGGAGFALAGLLLFASPLGTRRRWSGLLMILASVGVLSAAGCSTSGGVSQTNTPAGTYTVNVTATGTNAGGVALSHTASVTFTVQ